MGTFEEDMDMKYHQTFLEEDGWMDVDIQDYWLDVTKEYKEPKFVLAINGVECFPLGGIQAITGQAGSGKTQVMSMLIASILGDKTHNIEYILDDVKSPSVLYIDTEMEEGNTQLVNMRVCAMLGTDPNVVNDRVCYLRLRDELTAVDRWKKTLKAIYFKKPTVVLLDGLIDVISDFNDNKECQNVIFKTMALATYYDIALIMVLHQNPNTTKMVGHAGSFLGRKATDVFTVKKIKDETSKKVSFILTQDKARAADVPDLEFIVDKSQHKFGVAKVLSDSSEDLETTKLKEMSETFKAFNFPANGKSYTELTGNIKALGTTSNRKIDNMITEALKYNIIKKELKRYYFIGYGNDPLGGCEQTDMPF